MGDHQVHPPVPINVAERRASLLPIHLDPACLARDGLKLPLPVSAQQEPTASIQTRGLRPDLEEILTQEQIFVSVGVIVRHTGVKRGGELSSPWKGPGRESIFLIQKNSVRERVDLLRGETRIGIPTEEFLQSGARKGGVTVRPGRERNRQ